MRSILNTSAPMPPGCGYALSQGGRCADAKCRGLLVFLLENSTNYLAPGKSVVLSVRLLNFVWTPDYSGDGPPVQRYVDQGALRPAVPSPTASAFFRGGPRPRSPQTGRARRGTSRILEHGTRCRQALAWAHSTVIRRSVKASSGILCRDAHHPWLGLQNLSSGFFASFMVLLRKKRYSRRLYSGPRGWTGVFNGRGHRTTALPPSAGIRRTLCRVAAPEQALRTFR
jgi:hypothetical protein